MFLLNFLFHRTFPQISFWIDNQSIPARTALGITTVLAMTTLLFGVQSSLPSVPYIKAVDLFMIVSFANVFAALVEFAVVNYTSMREKERKQPKDSKPSKKKYTVVSRSHIHSHKTLKNWWFWKFYTGIVKTLINTSLHVCGFGSDVFPCLLRLTAYMFCHV